MGSFASMGGSFVLVARLLWHAAGLHHAAWCGLTLFGARLLLGGAIVRDVWLLAGLHLALA